MARTVWLILAVICSVVAGAGVLLVRRMAWAPAASFDITGFLWLLMNLGPLLVSAGVLACGVCAIYCWIRVLQESL
jgi:hypothetical protein